MAVEYIPRTRDLYSDFKPYQWVVNETVPWTPLTQADRAKRKSR